MALPLLAPLTELFRARTSGAAGRAATGSATVALATVATALVVAAGLVALTAEIGFPLAALAFAAVFAVLALTVHLLGRARSARQAAQAAAAQRRAEADIAVAASMVRSAKPFLPLAVFVAAFTFMRRP